MKVAIHDLAANSTPGADSMPLAFYMSHREEIMLKTRPDWRAKTVSSAGLAPFGHTSGSGEVVVATGEWPHGLE